MIPKPQCVVCHKRVTIRAVFSTMRDDDATWSNAMRGWVCFACQSEPVERAPSPDFEDETDPNFCPDWNSIQ